MSNSFEYCAFDIETQGVDHDSGITAMGFGLNGGYQLFLNTGGEVSGDCGISTLNDSDVNKPVKTEVFETEEQLLRGALEFSNERLKPRDIIITGYNAETWDGGFDLPHLRARCHAHNIGWILDTLAFVDLFSVKDMVQHSVQNTEVDDLDGLFEIYFPNLSDFDQLDGRLPVSYWHNEEFERLLLHNLADVWKTRKLALMYDRFVSKSDWGMKKLNPPNNAR